MMRKKQTTDITVSNNTNSKNSELPFDIVFDILTRLPVKSLLQFKTVCKTWYSLIVHNPTFIKLHPTRSKLNTLSSLLVITYPTYPTTTFTMQLQSRDKTHVLKPNSNPNPKMLFEYIPRIIGICDGLVCATFENSETTICNPTIGQVRQVPLFCLTKLKKYISFDGFGSKDDDFKLFRIFYPKSESEVVVRAEMYSMKTDIWRDVGVVNNGVIDTRVRCNSSNSVPVAINEVFYWDAYSFGSSCVMTFDMNGYIFGVISCPKEFTEFSESPRGELVDLKGELAFTCYRNIQWFEMWVLNKTERCWTMRLRVDDLPWIGRGLRVLGCERNGCLLMRRYSPGPELNIIQEIVSYDPESQNIMPVITYTEKIIISIHLPKALAKVLHLGNIFMYTESLLPVLQ